ncbi:MAG: hypothetical protein WD490_09555 [Opitutales bacterium]
MKLLVAGQECSEQLGRELEQAAEQRPDAGLSGLIAGESAILCLKDAPDESRYLIRHLDVLRSRHSVDPSILVIPCDPGLAGRGLFRIRQFLWKLILPLQNQITFCQNTVNRMLAHHLCILQDQHLKELQALERRMRVLEKRTGADDPTAGGGNVL